MHVKLFVGSLSWNIGDSELEALFRVHGEVQSARVITDRETGRSRGFGFVEMETADLAALISATDGQEVDGRTIRVHEAEERRDGGAPRRTNRDFGGASRRDNRGSRNRY